MCYKNEVSNGLVVSCMLGDSFKVEDKMLCLEQHTTKKYTAWTASGIWKYTTYATLSTFGGITHKGVSFQ